MVWYGAADPRGKLDFFEVGGMQISEIITDFFGVFYSHIATKISHCLKSLYPLLLLRYSPFARYSFAPLSLYLYTLQVNRDKGLSPLYYFNHLTKHRDKKIICL